MSGDIRLRYESNFGDRNARNRDRGVLRARLRGSYAVTDEISIGGTFYRFKPKGVIGASMNEPSDWLIRLRVNLTSDF